MSVARLPHTHCNTCTARHTPRRRYPGLRRRAVQQRGARRRRPLWASSGRLRRPNNGDRSCSTPLIGRTLCVSSCDEPQATVNSPLVVELHVPRCPGRCARARRRAKVDSCSAASCATAFVEHAPQEERRPRAGYRAHLHRCASPTDGDSRVFFPARAHLGPDRRGTARGYECYRPRRGCCGVHPRSEACVMRSTAHAEATTDKRRRYCRSPCSAKLFDRRCIRW